MERTAAIAELPEAYAAAIRLRDEQFDNEVIAKRLGITIEAVEPLLRVAVAKLDRIRGAAQPSVREEPHSAE